MTESRPRIWRMRASEMMVLLRYGGHGLGCRNGSPPTGQQCGCRFTDHLIEQLFSDCTADHFGKQRGHRAAHLSLSRSSTADNVDIIGKGLKPTKFSDAESPVGPVERPDRWTRL